MGRPSKYPAEFQAEAVRLVLTTDTPRINYRRLGAWVRKEREQQTLTPYQAR
ncbi:MAG TPA: hypothetical protein VHO29_18425 [Marmoricola sp.]|nr:hypothetical protein [Marmoricola sp.]